MFEFIMSCSMEGCTLGNMRSNSKSMIISFVGMAGTRYGLVKGSIMDGCVLWTSTPECVRAITGAQPAARQHTRELMSTTHAYPWLIPFTWWFQQFWLLNINISLPKYKLKFELRAFPARVAKLPHNLEGKYHSRPHPHGIRSACDFAVPVLMRALELR